MTARVLARGGRLGLGGSRGFWAQDRVSPGSLALDIGLVVGTGVEFMVYWFFRAG